MNFLTDVYPHFSRVIRVSALPGRFLRFNLGQEFDDLRGNVQRRVRPGEVAGVGGRGGPFLRTALQKQPDGRYDARRPRRP